ncbi:MAG TPA: hypothetical protein EYN67_03890 [Flavobacteriales bacterium]|nr:hypothetical protein [Flavobacteriales bacterium]
MPKIELRINVSGLSDQLRKSKRGVNLAVVLALRATTKRLLQYSVEASSRTDISEMRLRYLNHPYATKWAGGFPLPGNLEPHMVHKRKGVFLKYLGFDVNSLTLEGRVGPTSGIPKSRLYVWEGTKIMVARDPVRGEATKPVVQQKLASVFEKTLIRHIKRQGRG